MIPIAGMVVQPAEDTCRRFRASLAVEGVPPLREYVRMIKVASRQFDARADEPVCAKSDTTNRRTPVQGRIFTDMVPCMAGSRDDARVIDPDVR